MHIDRETHRTLCVGRRVHIVCVGVRRDNRLGGIGSDVVGVWRILWLGRWVMEVLGAIFYRRRRVRVDHGI